MAVTDKIQSLIREYGNELKYSDTTIRKASKFVQNDEPYLLFQGKNPHNVAIVSLYISGLTNCEYRTRKELTQVSGISEPAIYQLIRNLLKMKREVLKEIPIIKKKVGEGKRWGHYASNEVDEVTATIEYITNLIPSLLRKEKDEKYKRVSEEVSSLLNKLFFNN